MSDILLKQYLEQLDRLGVFEMAALPSHIDKVMVRLQTARPEVCMVGRMRNGVLGQLVYLPAHRQTVRDMLREDLAVFEEGVAKTREILATL